VPVPLAAQPLVRALVVPAGLLDGAHDVLELGLGVRARTAEALQRGAGPVGLAAQDQAAGGVRDEQGAQDDDGGGDDGEAERHAPAPPGDTVREVVGDGGGQ
jgi:hypothetical protein